MENQKQITLPVVLKGDNYLLWSRTTKTVLRSRGLWEHVVGSVEAETDGGAVESPITSETSKGDSKWIQEDQLVLAVLQSSLEQSILAAYSYAETAKELWDTLLGVYGNTSNLSRVFEVKKALNDLQQEEKSFKELFGDFRALWAELELLRPPTTDLKEMNLRREEDQVFGLLLTLNGSFKGLIHHILRFEKLPTLNEVCMMIQKEEGSRGLFQGTSEAAHVSRSSNQQVERKNVGCDHCKRQGHTKDKCWVRYPHLRPKWAGNDQKWTGSGQTSRVAAGYNVTTNDDVVRKSDLDALIKSITKLTESGKIFLASKSHKPIIVDSGATDHMICDAKLMNNVKPHSGKVIIANGKDVPIRGIGDLELFKRNTKALFVPEFSSNLLSVQKATKDLDCLAVFSPNEMWFQDNKSGETIGEGSAKDGLYVLDKAVVDKVAVFSSALSSVSSSLIWHARLGHPHSKALQLILPNLAQDHHGCEACILGKHCRTVFPESSTVYDECFELIHSDVWTAPCASRDQYKYFVSFIDEKSKYTWVTLMPSKSHVFEAFSKFQSYVSTQFGAKIKILRSDNGGEYMSSQFKELLGKLGIVHQTSCAYTPQQNGVAERKNRHLMEVARTMMFDRCVPKQYWGDAVMTTCYLINRLPTKSLSGKSPYEVLTKDKPSIKHLRVFGCVCYVFVPEAQRNKLEPKSIKCMFVGYSPTQKGYKCYNPETRRVYVSREVKFDEENGYFSEKNWDNLKNMVSPGFDRATILKFILDGLNTLVSPKSTSPAKSEESIQNDPSSVAGHDTMISDESNTQEKISTQVSEENAEGGETQTDDSTPDLDAVVEDSEEEGADVESAPPPRRSERLKFGPDHWKNTRVYYNNEAVAHPIQTYCSVAHLPEEHQAFLSQILQDKIPKTYEEACGIQVWVDAMDEEMGSMKKNNTFDMVDLPDGKKLVGCRWVYTIKYMSTGEVERYKARLVARGFTQTYGVDYTDTFAPVAKLKSVRVLLSLATNLSWDLWQMDVKNAFLQGDLEEEVYMMAPPGYHNPENSSQVCKLNKAIYGLKQSPRAWYQRLCGALLQHGFRRSEADHSLFTVQGENGIVVVLIYVDDIVITGDDKSEIEHTKKLLKTEFDIKDLGKLKYFLGIEVCRFDEGLFLSQRKYTLDLLEETGKLASKPAKTPIEESYQDLPEGEPFENAGQYRRIVGKLIYLSITRPDISFAVNKTAQFMQAPTQRHWGMVERILRYLKCTSGKGIWMSCNGNSEIVGYCDADWAGDKMDRKSTTGYCTFVGGNLVTWKSKKQKVVSLSSAEAEYRAMRAITKELIWLKALLLDLGVNQDDPMSLHCDNQAAIHIASNSVFHERTKHVELDCHFVREKVQAGIISPSYVKGSEQLADILTKATSSKVCDSIYGKIGLLDLHQPILRGNVELDQNQNGN